MIHAADDSSSINSILSNSSISTEEELVQDVDIHEPVLWDYDSDFDDKDKSSVVPELLPQDYDTDSDENEEASADLDDGSDEEGKFVMGIWLSKFDILSHFSRRRQWWLCDS